MKTIQVYFIIALLSFCYSGCKKKTSPFSRTTYVWFETEIYDASGDSIISIMPQSAADVYIIEFETWRNDQSFVTISKGGKLLLQCGVEDFYSASGDETNCLYESYCYKMSCDNLLCTRYFGEIDGQSVTVIYQFPFLEGNFQTNCHSSSLFKKTYEALY